MKISKLFHWLYALVMLLPIFAIGVKCGYTMFNKNAYQSYYGQTINESQYNLVNDSKELIIGKTYHFKSMSEHKTLINSSTYYIGISNMRNLVTTYQNTIDTTNISGFYLTDYTSNYIIFKDTINNSDLYTINITINNLEFDFDFVSYNYPSINTYSQYMDNTIYSVDYNKFSFVDNVFYYSVNQVTENPLFNWTQNTFIYTGVQTFTNALNINNVFFPLLLSYWMILSVVYIIYDLGLMMIQIVHRKIHELGDSI